MRLIPGLASSSSPSPQTAPLRPFAPPQSAGLTCADLPPEPEVFGGRADALVEILLDWAERRR